MSVPVQPPKTRGDVSAAAATANADDGAIDISVVSYAAPNANDPTGPHPGSIGDYVYNSQSTLTGGTELTIAPLEEPAQSYRLFKLSPILSNIHAAMVANVYAAGFSLVPVLNVDDPEALEKIREDLAFRAALTAGSYEDDTSITDAMVEEELKRIRSRIRNESFYLRAWFARACPGSTYLQLCQLLGYDLEQGDAYAEVLRDANGFPSKLIWAPAWSIRAKPIGTDLIPVNVPVQVSDLTWAYEVQALRFRSYVQTDLNNEVIGRYKEYGDPRCLARRTGRYYNTYQEMVDNPDEWLTARNAAGEEIRVQPLAATELLHFKLPNPLSLTYGKSEYTGVWPALEGTRDLAEENSSLIVDRKVPQMFIMIAGGAGVNPESIKRLQDQIEENQKQGKKSIYFIHARPAKTDIGRASAAPSIHVERTKSEQYQDALGLKYSEHAEAMVQHAYRIPKAALGQHDGLTEGQMQSGYRYTEAQVYDPRRDIIDDRMNSTIVRDLGAQLTRYKTRARTPKEPNELAQIIKTLMESGVLTPDEGRALSHDIFNREFKDLEGIWSKLPTKLLLAMLQTKNQLVAAALLGSESESDVIARLQQALVAQLQGQPAADSFGEAGAPKKPDEVDEEEDDAEEPDAAGG